MLGGDGGNNNSRDPIQQRKRKGGSGLGDMWGL
jgi:hypothetical protein